MGECTEVAGLVVRNYSGKKEKYIKDRKKGNREGEENGKKNTSVKLQT